MLTFQENRTWLIGYELPDVMGWVNTEGGINQGLAGAGDTIWIKNH